MCSDKSSHLRSICVTEESAVNTAEVEIIECNVNIIRCDVTYLHHKTHIFTDLHSYNAFFSEWNGPAFYLEYRPMQFVYTYIFSN